MHQHDVLDFAGICKDVTVAASALQDLAFFFKLLFIFLSNLYTTMGCR